MRKFATILIVLFFLSACSLFSKDEANTSTQASGTGGTTSENITSISPLPTPLTALTTSSSPVVTSDSSPLSPPSAEIPEEFRFSINEELLVIGATQVEGTGPPGIGIIIVDVTLMGQRLGDGYIQPDGTFSIYINPPLEKYHYIGIQVGVPVSQEAGPEYLQQFVPYAGDGVMDMMMVGTLWDTAEVQ